MRFLLLLIFIKSAIATEYLMPELVLKKAIIDQSEIISTPHQCHDLMLAKSSLELGDQSFLATIDCHFSCLGSDIQNKEIKENFFTKDQYLTRGDGAMWAGLASTLQMWSGEICMKVAQAQCGSLKKIDKFLPPSLSSGNWKFNEKLSCNNKTTSIISPFDKSNKL